MSKNNKITNFISLTIPEIYKLYELYELLKFCPNNLFISVQDGQLSLCFANSQWSWMVDLVTDQTVWDLNIQMEDLLQ